LALVPYTLLGDFSRKGAKDAKKKDGGEKGGNTNKEKGMFYSSRIIRKLNRREQR
jgi:hypothetical protein